MLGVLGAVTAGFHDCVQPRSAHRQPPGFAAPPAGCSGGLCVGMHNGPHEDGPSSYPAGSLKEGFTKVSSTMTVPEKPLKLDSITYYIWTDIFFGDMSFGRMNQFVPQLILGSALDASSGPPHFTPKWGEHTDWAFGAQYDPPPPRAFSSAQPRVPLLPPPHVVRPLSPSPRTRRVPNP